MSIELMVRGVEKQWRMEVYHEVWEFKDRSVMETVLKQMLEFKDSFGRLDKRIGSGECI